MNLNLALTNKQLLALIVLVFLTLVVLSTVLFSVVAHVNVWNTILSFLPEIAPKRY